MIIRSVKSICCGEAVKTRTPKQIKDDPEQRLYVCLECRRLADAYFVCEIERELG